MIPITPTVRLTKDESGNRKNDIRGIIMKNTGLDLNKLKLDAYRKGYDDGKNKMIEIIE